MDKEEQNIFVTPQEELAEEAWNILGNIQNDELRDKKRKEFKAFLEGLK